MNKYLSVMGLFISRTMYRILIVTIAFMAAAELVGGNMIRERWGVYPSGGMIFYLLPFGVAVLVQMNALTSGKSNPQYLLRRLQVTEKEMALIFALTSFLELLMVWMMEMLTVWGMGYLVSQGTGHWADPRKAAILMNDNPVYYKLFPIENSEIFICDLMLLILLAAGIAVTNLYRLKGYVAIAWLLSLGAVILYFISYGAPVLMLMCLALVILLTADVLLIRGYRKELKNDTKTD